MNQHHCVPRSIAFGLQNRRDGPVQQLVSDLSELGVVKPELSTEPNQPILFSCSRIPFGNRLCKRLLDLAFDCDHAQFVAEARYHHQVSLAVATR